MEILGVACEDIAKHEAFLSATSTMLHPNNYQAIVTKRILTQLYGRNMNTGVAHSVRALNKDVGFHVQVRFGRRRKTL